MNDIEKTTAVNGIAIALNDMVRTARWHAESAAAANYSTKNALDDAITAMAKAAERVAQQIATTTTQE